MTEYPTCYPGIVADRDGIYESDICKEKRMDAKERNLLMLRFDDSFTEECTEVGNYDPIRRRKRRFGMQMDAQNDRYGSIRRSSGLPADYNDSNDRARNATRDIKSILREETLQYAKGEGVE